MTPTRRTPQQRDQRFARIRHLSQLIFVGSGAVSALLVGYAASAAKPVTPPAVTTPTVTAPVTTPTTTAPSDTAPSSGATPTTVYTPPTTVPATTTTVCTTTPSGTMTCH